MTPVAKEELPKRLKPCPFCGAYPELSDRSGGWTVDCPYSSPLHAVLDNHPVCSGYEYWENVDRLDYQQLYPTPNHAVVAWNKIKVDNGEIQDIFPVSAESPSVCGYPHGHYGPYIRTPEGHVLCSACGKRL